jgi:hypothetical protein
MLLLVSLQVHSPSEAPNLTDLLLGASIEADPVGTFSDQTSPMVRAFLWTLGSTSVRATESHAAGDHGLFRAHSSAHDACERRALALQAAFASLLGANQSGGQRSSLGKLSCFQEMAAVILMLDQKGASESVMNRLKKLNICAGPNDARVAIRRAATLLDLKFVFPEHRDAEGANTSVLVPGLLALGS